MNNKIVKRGDIYYADLGNNKGSIQSGMRPVVVYQNDVGNKYSTIVNVYSITSKKKTSMPTHVKIGTECGLEKESTVTVEQVFTLNQSDLIEYIGKCTDKVYKEICKAVKIQHGWTDVRFNENYIRERMYKINKLDILIEKYQNTQFETLMEKYEKIALMGEIITYCNSFGVNPKNYLQSDNNTYNEIAI